MNAKITNSWHRNPFALTGDEIREAHELGLSGIKITIDDIWEKRDELVRKDGGHVWYLASVSVMYIDNKNGIIGKFEPFFDRSYDGVCTDEVNMVFKGEWDDMGVFVRCLEKGENIPCWRNGSEVREWIDGEFKKSVYERLKKRIEMKCSGDKTHHLEWEIRVMRVEDFGGENWGWSFEEWCSRYGKCVKAE